MVIVKDIFNAVHPILLTTASFGLSSIMKTENGKLKIFNALKIVNVLYLAAFTILLYAGASAGQNNKLQRNYATGVLKIGVIFQILSQICLTYIIYIFNISKSGQILSFINDIRKIDEIFENLGAKINYRRHFVYEISTISLGFSLIFARSVISFVYMRHNIIAEHSDVHFVMFFPDFVSFLLQTYFTLLISLLYERFGMVNRLLDELREDKSNERSWKIKPPQEFIAKYTLKKITFLMELHDYLTDVGDKISESFSIQMLSCFTAQFLKEVFTTFFLYYESLVLKNRNAAFVWFIWTITTSMEIFFVTVTCHLTSREARIAGTAIHKVLLNEHDALIKRKLIIFSQQVSHRSLQFTACGLFSIDATLIFTIAGAASTYLLIMLQFQEGLEAQCSINKK